MFISVTDLYYWKSERKKAEECEDARAYDIDNGLFVVADGVGTASFSNIWARILTEQFNQHPLISADPFEVEYWLRTVQAVFATSRDVPTIEYLQKNDPLVVEKARQGSLSTLVGLRITGVETTRVTASPIATIEGDSCIFIKRKQETNLVSFPISKAEDFDRNPICLPSNLAKFNRTFHKMKVGDDFVIHDGDIILIATDAVSRWIIGCGKGKHASQAICFEQIINCTPQDWAGFIDNLRKNNEIVDDDCAALVLRFSTHQHESYELLKPWRGVAPEWIDKRQAAFKEANAKKDKVLMAVCWGDGQWSPAGMPKLDRATVRNAQDVANALIELRHALSYALDRDRNRKNTSVREIVAPVWKKWEAANLGQEPNAANLINSLKQSGFDPFNIKTQPVSQAPKTISSPARQSPSEAVSPPHTVITPPVVTPMWESIPELKELLKELLSYISQEKGFKIEESVINLSKKKIRLDQIPVAESSQFCTGFQIALYRLIHRGSPTDDDHIYLISQLRLFADHEHYFEEKLSPDEFKYIQLVKSRHSDFKKIIDELNNKNFDQVYHLMNDAKPESNEYLNKRLSKEQKLVVEQIQGFVPIIRKLTELLEKDNGTGYKDDEIITIVNDFRRNYPDFDYVISDISDKIVVVKNRKLNWDTFLNAYNNDDDKAIAEAYDKPDIRQHYKLQDEHRQRFVLAKKRIQIRSEFNSIVSDKEKFDFLRLISIETENQEMKWFPTDKEEFTRARNLNELLVKLTGIAQGKHSKQLQKIFLEHERNKKKSELDIVIKKLSIEDQSFIDEFLNNPQKTWWSDSPRKIILIFLGSVLFLFFMLVVAKYFLST